MREVVEIQCDEGGRRVRAAERGESFHDFGRVERGALGRRQLPVYGFRVMTSQGELKAARITASRLLRWCAVPDASSPMARSVSPRTSCAWLRSSSS